MITNIKVEGGTIEEVADMIEKLKNVFKDSNYKFWVIVDIKYQS